MNQAAGAARHNIYAAIHKGLRAFMTHALVHAGRVDPRDSAELKELRQEVHALLDICTGHLQHENEVIHAAMEARRPGSSQRLADDHVTHLQDIQALRELLGQLDLDAGASQALYERLSAFVAHNFEHMASEESEHNEVLWATHSDAEILALEQRIVARLSPAESALAMRWMLPHLRPDERAGKLAEMRRHAPPEAFERVLDLLRPLLGGRDWLKLSQALDL